MHSRDKYLAQSTSKSPKHMTLDMPSRIYDERRNNQASNNKRKYSHSNESNLIDKKRDKSHIEQNDYFESINTDDSVNISNEYQVVDHNEEQEEEEDPLDAYMNILESDMKKPEAHTEIKTNLDTQATQEPLTYKASASNQDVDRFETKIKDKGIRLDIDDSCDIEESYYRSVNSAKDTRVPLNNDESIRKLHDSVTYDRDGRIINIRKIKNEIDPLPSIDHSKIKYDAFEKVFYKEHEDICRLTEELVEDLRAKLDIKVTGSDIPRPVCSFAHFNFDEKLLKIIRRSEFATPTPIQAQAIPAALSGRNVLGIAVTGSGKTAAYLWPMLIHMKNQPPTKKGEGPIGLILVPTRELALQVYSETKKFSVSYNLSVVCAYGGGSKYEQSKDLELGPEIVIATPGRLIDLIKSGVTNLNRVTYLVLDEADRFFDMGFEIQVRSICDHIRPDRQTLLFSATFKSKIEKLARCVIDNPIKIVQKQLGEANEDVTQHFVFISEMYTKWNWLIDKLKNCDRNGSYLIFVTRISNSEELHQNLIANGFDNLLLHGDMDQSERNRVMKAFKNKDKDLMIATDVAARGLDIPHIKTVINYDIARDIDTHIHRIGRTGRAGNKGDAFTLLSYQDREFAGQLVKNLQSSNQEVPSQLLKLAMKSKWYIKQSHQKSNNDKKKFSFVSKDSRKQFSGL